MGATLKRRRVEIRIIRKKWKTGSNKFNMGDKMKIWVEKSSTSTGGKMEIGVNNVYRRTRWNLGGQ